MLDLTEPSHSGRSAARSWPYVASSACASIGSPSVVPVPCASTTSTSAGDSPAFASACRITRCCDGPFGAVRPLRRAVLVDRRAADHRQHPVAVAPGVRQPLQQQHADALGPAVPSAAAANGLHRPSARQPALPAELRRRPPGSPSPSTPPASASEHSPLPQRLRRQVQRHQRRRARRVHRDAPGPRGRRCRTTRPDATLVGVAGDQVALDAVRAAVRPVP